MREHPFRGNNTFRTCSSNGKGGGFTFDVRPKEEYEEAHIPGAVFLFLAKNGR
ncbi:rhodanese-like domain-containing protein [Lysinibacillus sp. RC79]|uniref:rhodanese-like domain-containing protein n=1 Tax=Lysinibacillus sp. RC79 TaxID=3156296 RepID=UPI00351121D8